MQNAGIAALGLNWRYLACDVHPTHLRLAIDGATAMKFLGLNLTVPHKLMAVDMVDALDESGKKWGAINTIRFEARGQSSTWAPLAQMEPDEVTEVRSVGFNTDADAIVRALHEDVRSTLRGACVLLLGAGGAGQVAARKLAEEGVRELYLVNRTVSKAEEIAEQLRGGGKATTVRVGYPGHSVDLVINATSLGLKTDDPLPFDPGKFDLRQAEAVYDMIYRPATTRLLEAAQAAGCRVANGLGMLLYQGAKALEIWTGKPAPIQAMKLALEQNIYGR